MYNKFIVLVKRILVFNLSSIGKMDKLLTPFASEHEGSKPIHTICITFSSVIPHFDFFGDRLKVLGIQKYI